MLSGCRQMVASAVRPPQMHESPRSHASTDAEAAEFSRGRFAWGRSAIVRGWAIAMVGVLAYLYAMLGSAAGPRDSLFASGIVGWIAIAALLVGTALWAAGGIVYLLQGERTDRAPDERA
jgi:hypothetical protein